MATASLRAAYEARGVDLAWARPLPSQSSAIIAGVGEALLPSSSQLPFQKPGETGGEGGEEPCVGRGSRKGCSFGCGAVPTALDAVDHVEVRNRDGGVSQGYGPRGGGGTAARVRQQPWGCC